MTVSPVASLVESSLAEMRAAAIAAGIGPGEPMASFVEAAALVALSIDRASTVYGERAVEAAQGARQAAETELERIRAQVKLTTSETTSSIAAAIREDVVRELQGWTDRLHRRTALAASLVLVSVALASGGTAYVAGRDAGRNQAVAASTGLQAALAAEPEQSRTWLELIRLNNIGFAVGHCTPIKVASGRACMVPLRLSWPGQI